MAKVLNARVVGRQSGPDRRYIGWPDLFGNPFVIGRDGTRAEVIAKYAEWAPTQSRIMAALPELAGKDLICWCAPLPCHGDVLLARCSNMFAAKFNVADPKRAARFRLCWCHTRRKPVCSDTQVCREHRAASRTAAPPIFPPVAEAILDPAQSLTTPRVIFHIIKEMTTMTIALEIQVEELRAELRNTDRTERRQIEAELELAEAELAVAIAEQEGTIDAAPPF